MRNDRLLLQDMLQSVDEVVASTPAAVDAFKADKYRQSHVLRHIQIVGEAAWRVSKELKDANTDVPWKQIAGIRHVLVHDYFDVNWDRVHDTALRHIPVLRAKIVRMLNSP